MNVAERKIKGALTHAAELHRNGDDPNSACIKAASFQQLNPDMTRRLVEGFNIGKTNATIAKAHDKTASFPIADIDGVLKGVFVDSPLQEKTASGDSTQKVASAPIAYSEEMPDVTFDFTNGQKVASVGELRHQVRQVNGLMEEHRHELSKIAVDVLGHEQNMESCLKGLIDYFNSSNNEGKFASFEGDVLSEYGNQAKASLDIIYEFSGSKDSRFTDLVKIGSANVQHSEPHRLFDKLAEATAAYHKACQEHGVKLAQALSERDELQSLINEASEIPKEEPKTAADLITGSFNKGGVAGNLLSALSVEAPAGTDFSAAQKGVTSAVGTQHGKAYEKGLEMKQRGPIDRADAEMENVKRRAILQGLMANDDIISKQQPQQIQAVYNTLLGFAPDLTLHPEVVRSFLRSSTAEQSVSPFTVNQIAEIQGNVLKNRSAAKAPAPGA